MMFKHVFMLLAVLVVANVNTYGQETESPVSKSLGFYICGGTGNINPGLDRVLAAHGEVGMSYSQNFEKAQWLTVTGALGICFAGTGFDPKGDAKAGTSGGFDGVYGKVSLGFADYFTLGLHTKGRIDLGLRYGLELAQNQFMSFHSDFEVFPLSKPLYGNGHTDPTTGEFVKTGAVLGLFQLRFVYGVNFAKEWKFDTDVRFKFDGKGKGIAGQSTDTLQAFVDSFNVRWNNTISYNNANGFGAWFQLRYEPKQIMHNRQDNVKFLTGITYAYDLSSL